MNAVDAAVDQSAHVGPAGTAADEVELLVLSQLVKDQALARNQRVTGGGFLFGDVWNAGNAGPDGLGGGDHRHIEVLEHPAFLSQTVQVGGRGQRVTPGTDAAGDRKSTRLNSSHVKISYAVFCLKKKKKIRAKTRSHKRGS